MAQQNLRYIQKVHKTLGKTESHRKGKTSNKWVVQNWYLRVSSLNTTSVNVKGGQYLPTAFTDVTILKE